LNQLKITFGFSASKTIYQKEMVLQNESEEISADWFLWMIAAKFLILFLKMSYLVMEADSN